MRELGGHEIDRLHCVQGDNIVVAPGITHHTDRLDLQEHRKGLADLVVEIVVVELQIKDGCPF